MLLVGISQRLAAQIQPLVSDWQMSHNRLGRWAVFGEEPEGSDATTHNISHCLLFNSVNATDAASASLPGPS